MDGIIWFLYHAFVLGGIVTLLSLPTVYPYHFIIVIGESKCEEFLVVLNIVLLTSRNYESA